MAGSLRLILVWLALMALLGLTFAGSFHFTGATSLTYSLGIALAKAVLIFWFFMHLREEGGLIRLAAIGAAAWLMILFLLTAADYMARGIL
jgi:cytochrome c oxidase subunit 4